jgi:thiol:disulfide interchange protein
MKRFLAIICLALFVNTPAFTQAAPEENLVKIRLVPEKTEVKSGETIIIGIEQTIADGWHTYWKNPGDSGSATAVTWVLPNGFEISPIQWPVPHKMPLGGMVNYGYDNNVVLLQDLKIPELLPPGPITFKIGVEVLVCKDICIPERGTYELTLNNGVNENNKDFINAARKKLPKPVAWKAGYFEENGQFILQIPAADLPKKIDHKTAEFFPEEWGVILNPAIPVAKITKGQFVLKQDRDQRPLKELKEIKGVIKFEDKAFEFTAVSSSPSPSIPLPSGRGGAATIFTAIVAAILGGIILNFMPCVFPVLSIKALSLVKLSKKEQKFARIQGLSYTAGVMLSFILIAGILIALRAGGSEIGWGFQLQSPLIVTLLAYLLFVIGLNLAGVFELPGIFTNAGAKLASGDGARASFFTGVLATLVATPCTAPFMGVAIGVALTQSPFMALLIFAALGFGLALPYLALCFIPALQKKLPKPGLWMENFRQFLAFPMFASVAWLVWVASEQSGSMAVLGALMGMVGLGFAAWMLRHKPQRKYWKTKNKILIVLALLFAFACLPFIKIPPSDQFGAVWSKETYDSAIKGNDPVFVEMTAAWCITCKVNHRVAIDRDSTRQIFRDRKITYLIGDWTNQDPAITKYINGYGRNGVPIYVFYGARNKATGERPEPRILPQILTPGIVAEATQ